MALTPDEANELAALQTKYGMGGAAPTPAAPEQSILSRIGQTAANIPSQAVEGVGNLLGSLVQTGVPTDMQSTVSVPKPYDIAPATTVGQQIVDTAGGIVSSLPQYLLPELAIGKVGAAVGIGGKTLTFLKGAGAGAINAQSEGPAGMAEQGAVLGSASLLNLLPRSQRVLPALALGLGAGALAKANGATDEESVIQGGVMGLLPMLPGQHGVDRPAPATRAEEANAERGIVPFNTGTRFTMGEGSNPEPVNINIPQRFQPDGTPYGGELPAPSMPLLQGYSAPATEGTPQLLDRSNPRGFTTGDVTSQPPNFTLGADTTVPINGGLPDRVAPLQLLGSDEAVPAAAKNVTSQPPASIPGLSFSEPLTPTLPPDSPNARLHLQHPPTTTQIISSAVNPGDGRILVGGNWNDAHDLIGMQHGITDMPDGSVGTVPQEQRGFLVHHADGTQSFVDRRAALSIARDAGQLHDPTQEPPLQSQDLRHISEKGSGDTTREVPKPASTEPPPEPAKEPDAPLKASAALSGAPDYMTADVSHLSPEYQEDAEYLRGRITSLREDGDVEGEAYAVNQLKELIVPKTQDSPQVVKNVTSQPPPKAASWLSDDSVGKPTSKAEYLAGDYMEPSFEEDARTEGKHAGELTGDLTVQGSDYAIPGDKEDAPEFGTHSEDGDDLVTSQEKAEPAEPITPFSESPTTNDNDVLAAILRDTHVDDEEYQPSAEEMKEMGMEPDPDPEPEGHPTGEAQPETTPVVAPEPASKVKRLQTKKEFVKAKTKARQTAKSKGDFDTWRAKHDTIKGISRAEAGMIDRDMLSFLARYGASTIIGGTVSAQQHPEDRLRWFLYGAAASGLAMRFGPGFVRMLLKDLPAGIKAEMDTIQRVNAKEGSATADLLHNIGAEDAGATGDGLARYARNIEKTLTHSDDAREILGRRNLTGLVAEGTRALDDIRDEYEKLSPAERGIYRDYIHAPAYISVGGKDVRNIAAETKFQVDMARNPEFAAKATTARNVIIKAQELIVRSLPDGELKKSVLATLGQYTTDAFRIFNDPKYRPTRAQIDGVVDELAHNKIFPDLNRTVLEKHVASYLDNIKRNRQLYTGEGGGSDGTLDRVLKAKMRIDPKLEADILKATGLSSVDEVVTSHKYLPPALQKRLTNAIKDGTYLTPAFRDLLGYYKDPVEKQAATLMKLLPAARAAKHFELINEGKTATGLDMAYTQKEASDKEELLAAKLKVTADPKDRQQIQAQLLDLRNRYLLADTPNFGILAGKMVPTDIADTLPDMTKGIYGSNTTAVGQGVAEFHRFMKVGQTALNPVSHIRQIVTTPILAGLANTSPGWLAKGLRIAFEKSPEAVKEMARMRELGIADTSVVSTEFNVASRRALTGYNDTTIMDRFLKVPGIAQFVDAYHYPDTALRIGTFLSHEQRILGRMAPDVASGRISAADAAKEAERQAVRYTNRYTMNYANVPGGVAALRKMPFLSMYLTYQYEIARITKNITMDALNGTGGGATRNGNRMVAATKLAGLAAVPAILQSISENSLSEKDRKDWDASQRLNEPYAKARFKYVLGRRADGSFRYLDFSPLIPTDEFNRFFRAAASGDPKQVLANNPLFGLDNTPALNVATELISGQSTRTGRPINTFGRALDAARQEVAPAVLGGYEFDNIIRALTPNDQGGLGVLRLGSGKGYSIADLLATYATGLRPTTVNVEWQKHTAVQQAAGQIAIEKQYMMDTVKSNVAADVKQLAVKRYTDAVKSIVAHLTDRLGMEPAGL